MTSDEVAEALNRVLVRVDSTNAKPEQAFAYVVNELSELLPVADRSKFIEQVTRGVI